jgi:hypothetical protein
MDPTEIAETLTRNIEKALSLANDHGPDGYVLHTYDNCQFLAKYGELIHLCSPLNPDALVLPRREANTLKWKWNADHTDDTGVLVATRTDALAMYISLQRSLLKMIIELAE